jgi:protein deglycase
LKTPDSILKIRSIESSEEKMKKNVLVPISTGFEEIETTTIVDVLRRAGVTVTLCGLKAGPVVGRSAIQILPDCCLDDLLSRTDFDAIVLPGGQPNARTLTGDERILNLLKQMNRDGKTVAAICAAPAALNAAGLLNHRKATIFPGCRADIPADSYVEEPVVISDGVITSRGPGTAMAFALELTRVLCGDQVTDKVASALLA